MRSDMTGRVGGVHIPISLDHTIAKRRRQERVGKTLTLDDGFHLDCCLNMNECSKEGRMIPHFEEPCYIDKGASV